MYRLKSFSLFLILFFASASWADEESHRKAAAELLEITQTEKTISDYARQVEQSLATMPMQTKLNTQQLQRAKVYQQRMMELVKNNLNWKKMKPDFVTVYATVYSEDELKGLTKFYQSELGKVMLKKTPVLMQQSMQITQMHMQRLAPQIQQLSQQMLSDIQKTAGRR